MDQVKHRRPYRPRTATARTRKKHPSSSIQHIQETTSTFVTECTYQATRKSSMTTQRHRYQSPSTEEAGTVCAAQEDDDIPKKPEHYVLEEYIQPHRARPSDEACDRIFKDKQINVPSLCSDITQHTYMHMYFQLSKRLNSCDEPRQLGTDHYAFFSA